MITWELSKLDYTYSDTPVDVQATVNSHLPIIFVGERPEVVTAVGGKLIVGVPGDAELVATQPGHGMWGAAQSVGKRFTVAKREVTVKARNAQYPVGYPLAIEYEYQTLVNMGDSRTLPDPYTKGCFTLLDATGEKWCLAPHCPWGNIR